MRKELLFSVDSMNREYVTRESSIWKNAYGIAENFIHWPVIEYVS